MIEQNFDTAFARVSQLVADFHKHEKDYLASTYSEQDVRKDFIDKFWIALGWDVNHETQKNPNEQEVKVERGVGVEGRIKKADYAFLTPNFRDVRFFVEAKKPARNIDNSDDYFQTIRYGWNAQAAVSILTDFEQFRVLDCRLKPDIKTARDRALPKFNFHYSEYADREKFAEIYYLFSREAAHAGKLEQFAAAMPKPTGKAASRRLFTEAYKPVDEEFLRELDEMRGDLARSFKNRNPKMNGEELTEATQRTLDRLVFMRFLEDKMIEPEPIVERLGDKGSAWGDFVAQSERLNRIYNGIIFKPHFIDDADFVVDEKVFAPVRERLAHTNTVYNFNYIPIHVLGSIYERFLGNVIVATDKRATVAPKPEVRKAGGVYYTPEYIVRYIVAETVGKMIDGKKPAEIAEMRFADIACGSGSFLLGVFDELLRYHTAYYNRTKTNRTEGVRAGCIENADGTLRLSLRQKKAILTRNIYGVDLDAQAVEVAQLSLFLRLLEDETTASAKGHQLEFRETMLPDLRANIKHGNSLIGWDISSGLFDDEEERKLYPMDFAQAFPEVMRRSGFDAIIGNPPYVNIENIPQKQREYFVATYGEQGKLGKRYDIYQVFVIKGLSLLKDKGLLGFILPNTFLMGHSYRIMRKRINEQAAIRQCVDLPQGVFKGVTVDNVLLFLQREADEQAIIKNEIEVNKLEPKSDKSRVAIRDWDESFRIPQPTLTADSDFKINLHSNPAQSKLFNKIESVSVLLGDVTESSQGIILYKTSEDAERAEYTGFQQHRGWKRLLRGKNIGRYETKWGGEYVNYGSWLWCARDEKFFDEPKILLHAMRNKSLARRLVATYDNEKYYNAHNLANIIAKKNSPYDLRFIIGLFNSNLINYWYKAHFPNVNINPGDFRQIPIRSINFSDKADRALHDRMVSLVEAMLNAKRQLQAARTDRDRDHYESKCAAFDNQIDQLVYELYELIPEEIAVIEAS